MYLQKKQSALLILFNSGIIIKIKFTDYLMNGGFYNGEEEH